jgi:hypothetical protein
VDGERERERAVSQSLKIKVRLHREGGGRGGREAGMEMRRGREKRTERSSDAEMEG